MWVTRTQVWPYNHNFSGWKVKTEDLWHKLVRLTSSHYRDPDSMSKIGNNREQYLASSDLHIYTHACICTYIYTPTHANTQRHMYDTCWFTWEKLHSIEALQSKSYFLFCDVLISCGLTDLGEISSIQDKLFLSEQLAWEHNQFIQNPVCKLPL